MDRDGGTTDIDVQAQAWTAHSVDEGTIYHAWPHTTRGRYTEYLTAFRAALKTIRIWHPQGRT